MHSLVAALSATELPTAALVWDSAQVRPTCDRSADLKSSVGAYLGRDAFENGAPFTIRISLRRAQGTSALVADVSKVDSEGNVWGVRSVTGSENCESLDEALTLVVALLLDPGKVATESETEIGSEPQTTLESSEHPAPSLPALSVDSETTSAAPPEEERFAEPGYVVISAGLGTTWGLLPFPNYGPRLQVLLKPRRFWGLQIFAGELAGSSVELPVSGQIDFRLLEAGAELCPLERTRDGFWLSGCAGLGLAAIRAVGHGLTPQHRETEIVAIPVARLQAAADMGRGLWLGGSLAVLFPIAQNRYTFLDTEGVRRTAFQMASPSFGFGVLAAWRVP